MGGGNERLGGETDKDQEAGLSTAQQIWGLASGPPLWGVPLTGRRLEGQGGCLRLESGRRRGGYLQRMCTEVGGKRKDLKDLPLSPLSAVVRPQGRGRLQL